MFRNFDNHDVYFDLNGKPLHGAVQFNLKDGSTPAAIFDSDRTPLANPQLTDAYGKTAHQVFINSDVRAYFYKYVGEGIMTGQFEEDGIDLSDEANWQLLYTVESAAIDERSITGESAAGVSTMAALRAIDPYEVPVVDGNRVITLYGYFEANDKEPVNYYFFEQSEQPDDNGAVIQPDDMRTGRWVMVQPTEHCDSRHYGVFPQDSTNAEIDHSTGIEQLISYCNFHSLRPYFNGSADYPYFIYTSLAVESLNPIDVSAGTKFVDKGTTNRFYGEWNGNPYFVNNKTNLRCATVKHSWNSRENQGVVDYIIDSAFKPAIVSDVNVVMAVAPAAGTYLTNCTVESVHKISNSIVLTNMEVRESWFASGYDWADLSIYGCDLQLKNFDQADTYIRLKNKQNEADYGDLGEQEVHNATFLRDAIAENFSGTATCQGSAELHNASATITFSGQTPDLNAIDCWLTVVATNPFNTLALRRGQIISASTVSVLSAVRFDDVDIDAPVSILGGELSCTGCRINQNISHIGDPVVENVRDCIFNAQIQIRGGGTNVLVNAVWQDNVGNVVDPISIDKTNMAVLDSAHSYKYSGNSGTFIPSDHVKFTHTLNFTDNFTTATQNDDYVMLTQDSQDAPPSVHFRGDALYEKQNPGFNHGFSGTVSLFRVGSDSFPVRVDWRVVSAAAGQMQQLAFNVAPLPFRMIMENAGGMTWNCYVYKGIYDMGGYNTYDTHIAVAMLNASTITNVSITGAFEAVR